MQVPTVLCHTIHRSCLATQAWSLLSTLHDTTRLHFVLGHAMGNVSPQVMQNARPEIYPRGLHARNSQCQVLLALLRSNQNLLLYVEVETHHISEKAAQSTPRIHPRGNSTLACCILAVIRLQDLSRLFWYSERLSVRTPDTDAAK